MGLPLATGIIVLLLIIICPIVIIGTGVYCFIRMRKPREDNYQAMSGAVRQTNRGYTTQGAAGGGGHGYTTRNDGATPRRNIGSTNLDRQSMRKPLVQDQHIELEESVGNEPGLIAAPAVYSPPMMPDASSGAGFIVPPPSLHVAASLPDPSNEGLTALDESEDQPATGFVLPVPFAGDNTYLVMNNDS